MNPDQENFDDLRKLLVLKKYEQPPPGYFAELPTRIWTRIEREPSESFWERFLPNFGINPAMAYSFGLLACGTLVFGIGYSLRTTEGTETAIRPLSDDIWDSPAPKVAASDSLGLSNFQSMTHMASTNPVMSAGPLPSLFGTPSIQVAPVNFSPAQ